MHESRDRDVERIASALVTPLRRTSRAPTFEWDVSFKIPGASGPIACWSAGRGPVALLVHGWEADHLDLESFVAPLRSRGMRVVAFDLPAHGESEGSTASIPDLADGVRRVGAHVAPVTAVIAHSLGCAATVVAMEQGLEIARLVLISSPERFSDGVRAAADHHSLDPAAVELALVRRGVDVPSLDLRQSARARKEPALFLHSSDDRVARIDAGRRVAMAWPGSEFVEFEGMGHTRILRDREIVARAVAFASDDAAVLD